MFKIIKNILFAVILIGLLPLSSHAQDEIGSIPSYINKPEDIVKWFSRDFTYQLIISPRPQTIRETMESKGGICGDFAELASVALTRMGIRNSIVAMTFKDTRIGHIVCMWKGGDGTYNFISNMEIHYTGERTIDAAIKKFFPAKKIIVDYDRAREYSLRACLKTR